MMFGFVQQTFIVLLSFGGSSATKCASLNSNPYMTRPTIIDLNQDKHDQGLCYYPVMTILDKYNENYNTLGDSSSRICSSIREDIKLNLFDMI